MKPALPPAIRTMLATRDDATVAQGVELLVALGDPTRVDALLEGTAWTPPGPADPNGCGVLTLGDALGVAPTRGAWDLWLALRLLAAAPRESVAATTLREQITSLAVSRRVSEDKRLDADLAPIAALRNLQRFRIEEVSAMKNASALASLPSLTSLRIVQPNQRVDLAGFGGLASLESLSVVGSSLSGAEPLALPALRSLDLRRVNDLGSLGLVRGTPSLETLHLRAAPGDGDLGPLRWCPALRELRIHTDARVLRDLDALAGCARLEHVALTFASELASIEGLRGARSLRSLMIAFSKLDSIEALRGLTTLTELRVIQTAVTDLSPLSGCDLQVADIDSSPVVNLRGLEGSRSLRVFKPRVAAHLVSLDGLEGCASLEEVSLASCLVLVDITALRGSVALRSLSIRCAPKLTDLSPLAGCASLEACELESTGVTDLRPLASLPKLVRLSLGACARVTDATPLAALTSLRALILSGTGVDRASLPPSLRPITSFAEGATFDAILARPPPAARKPAKRADLDDAHRDVWPKLKKLLLTRDAALIDQGVELVRALGDASLYDALLRGVGWAPGEASHASDEGPPGALTMRGSFFEDTGPATPFRVRAVLALAATAPQGCEAADALKRAVTSLALGDDGDAQPSLALDLAPLAAFTKLERLNVRGSAPIANAAALEGHPSLRRLTWKGHDLAALPDLAKLPALTSLALESVGGDVADAIARLTSLQTLTLNRVKLPDRMRFEGFTALRELHLLYGSVRSLSLRGCASLASLSLYWFEAERIDLRGCTALSALRLQGCQRLRELPGFEALASLASLSVDYCAAEWMPAAPAPALTALTRVYLVSLHLDDAARIANLPAVTSLAMTSSITFRDASALASMTTLRELDLSHCMQLSDVSALASLSLTRLRLHRTCVDRQKLPPSLRKVVRWG